MLLVGAFDLVSPVARGASGTVWQAFHRASGERAAVKVLDGDGALDAGRLRAFRAEVRKALRLRHPHIVEVLDHGRVERDQPPDSPLPPGAPWLAMEWAGGGALRGDRLLSWEAVDDLARALLSALAHAHSRGLLHRDIKPANILLSDPDAAWPGPRLVDFGGAAWRAGDQADRAIVGTPTWMPPERLRGAWWEDAPSSDLYGLACVLWYVLTGQMPHGGADREQVVAARLTGRIQPFAPRFVVPDGVEDWLRAMLVPAVGLRTPTAAAALAALQTLSPERLSRPRTALEDRLLDAAGRVSPGDRRPPLPRDWRSTAPPLRASAARRLQPGHLRLGGREGLRDRLWRALGQVRDEGRARLVVLRGPTGMGRRDACEWLAEAGEELGVVEHLRALHAERPGRAHGLGPMFARWLGLSGLAPETAVPVIEGRLAAHNIDITDAGVGLASVVGAGGVGVAHPGERHGRMVELLWALGRRRVALVCLHELQWGADAARLIQGLSQARSGILVVATWSTDQTPVAGVELDRLLALPDVDVIDVGPLPAAELARSLHDDLDLDETLSQRIARRAAGSPAYALQLVEAWTERGLLVRGPHGFELAPGAAPVVPAGLGAAWLARVDAVVGADDGLSQALELGAVMGVGVVHDEWVAGCAALHLELPAGALDGLVAAGLLVAEPGGFAFAHAMLRDALVERAAAAGRLADLHAVCARVLPPDDVARLGGHLAASGRAEDALGPLSEAVAVALDQGATAQATVLLDALDAALATAGLPSSDPRHGRARLLRCRRLRTADEHVQGERLASQLVQDGLAHGWGDELVQGFIELARHTLARGELDRAEALLREAEQRCRDLGDPVRMSDVLRAQGVVLLQQGRLGPARTTLTRALELLAGQDELLREAGCLLDLSHALVQMELPDLAETAAEQALSRYQTSGSRWGVANAHNALGEVARIHGELDVAARHYREAARLNRRVAPALALVPTVNLGLTLVLDGRPDEGRAVLLDALHAAGDAHTAALAAVVHAGLALAAAARGEWVDLQHHVAMVDADVRAQGLVERDIAVLLDAAAERAGASGADQGALAGAEMARDVAARQWATLRRP
ncbi:MAG: protein kinase [Alphaproteobacteria bacterium]|nr:protein kinase [Alphaproteobacteria bacterium]